MFLYFKSKELTKIQSVTEQSQAIKALFCANIRLFCCWVVLSSYYYIALDENLLHFVDEYYISPEELYISPEELI